MITWEEAYKNPELMIKHKNDLRDEMIFGSPWSKVFEKYPYLYREFSDRFNELGGVGIACALINDPTLVLDLKDYLYNKMSREIVSWVLRYHPKLSLCLEYRDNVDEVEAAYYITFPHKLNNLNNEEKREMGKRIIELLKEERIYDYL